MIIYDNCNCLTCPFVEECKFDPADTKVNSISITDMSKSLISSPVAKATKSCFTPKYRVENCTQCLVNQLCTVINDECPDKFRPCEWHTREEKITTDGFKHTVVKKMAPYTKKQWDIKAEKEENKIKFKGPGYNGPVGWSISEGKIL